MKPLRNLALLALLVLTLSACEMRTWLDIDISDSGAGEVIVTVGFDEQFRELLGEAGGAEDLFGEIESEAEAEGWTVTPFVDEDIEGITVTRSFSSIEELNEILNEAPTMAPGLEGEGGPMVEGVTIVDTGDTIRFEGSIPGADPDDLEGVDLEEALGVIEFDARVAVTFPGDVTEHNGELVGRTVTWRFFDEDFAGVDMFAEARKGGGISGALIGAIALAAIIAAVVFYRLRGRPSAEPASAPGEVVATTGVEAVTPEVTRVEEVTPVEPVPAVQPVPAVDPVPPTEPKPSAGNEPPN